MRNLAPPPPASSVPTQQKEIANHRFGRLESSPTETKNWFHSLAELLAVIAIIDMFAPLA
ncbi:hypothetical protein FACS189454_01890 [Planctomycetales bacterium]|nr:hypothetical protein FACS189454_01890 [Planctomycetales bacterium]